MSDEILFKMNRIKNEWADYTWNPVTGCLRNYDFCYAKELAETRLRGWFGYPEGEPFKPIFHPNRLLEPMRIKKSGLHPKTKGSSVV